uniref:Uncharacterized protein n=1 Tax=Rhizophagus irregularis (strain DAOM 181602 / DAOM 197198 / MUCL 43194) TaxID=747089 RepID=U9UMZ7_RHIID
MVLVRDPKHCSDYRSFLNIWHDISSIWQMMIIIYLMDSYGRVDSIVIEKPIVNIILYFLGKDVVNTFGMTGQINPDYDFAEIIQMPAKIIKFLRRKRLAF